MVIGVVDDESSPNGRRYLTKAIETIQPGERVLAREEFGERLSMQPVMDLFHNQSAHLRWLTLQTLDGCTSKLPTTDSHPFWVHEQQNWIEAGKLEPGMTFTGPHNQPVKLLVTHLEEFHDLRPVYTLEVNDAPTFFVLPDGSDVPVLVHNAKKCPGGSASDGASKKADGGDFDMHHTIPREIRRSRSTGKSLLPDHLVEHPDIVGRPGLPNRRSTLRDVHRDIHNRNREGGDYNTRFKEMLKELEKMKPDQDSWTAKDITNIRDKLLIEFDL